MIRILWAALLLALCATVCAQTYTPIQHAHAGIWGDPERVGEGAVVLPTYQLGRPFAFVAIFMIEDGVQRNLFADVDLSAKPLPGLGPGVYEIVLYDRPEINAQAVRRGTGWLAPVGDRLYWSIDAGEIQRAGDLSHVVRPVLGVFGRCGSLLIGFSPPRPAADPFWCVD